MLPFIYKEKKVSAQAYPREYVHLVYLYIRAQGVGGGHNTRIETAVFFCSGSFFFFNASSSSQGGFSAHFAQCSYAPVMHSDLTWRLLILGMSDRELRFSLQAITNMTPTPDNLQRWGNSEIDSACSLCGQTCTLRHVLNACKVSLLQGR